MIRVEQLRGWVETQAERLRPRAVILLARLRVLLAAAMRWTAATWTTGRERVRPVAEAAGPQARRARAVLPQAASGAFDGVLPAAARAMGAVRRQVESGRDARGTARELRDSHGRRLRASLYALGPEGIKRGRRRARAGTPHVAGSLLPAAVKIGIVVLIAGFGFLASSSAYINYAADLPDAHQITTNPLPEDTMIYASDGTLLADVHNPNDPQHYYESLDQMGKWLPDATVAIEDAGFWTEPGIDVFAMGRAALIDYRQKQAVQGASTITQQLVKVRLTGNEVSIDRKVKEAVLAIQVEHTYTKRQILEQYLNSIDYGNHARGSLAASRVYFHKDTKDLDLAQASMLAGIPQSPYENDPFSFWDHAKSRQLEVLKAMVRTHKVTQEQADEAYAEDLSPPQHMFGPTGQVLQAPAFVDWVEAQIADKYGSQALYGGGLQVVTTINLQLEAEAQRAVSDEINKFGGAQHHESQGAMTAIDPRTGAVVAMVGSANSGTQYNFAWRNPRSPGSSFKIYTYTAAIESGKFTMATMIPDTPVTITCGQGCPPYSPKNYDGGYHGTMQLQQAMGNSYNVPAVKTEMAIGVDRAADMAKRMGAPPFTPHYAADGSVVFTTDDPSSSFGPSLTLGGYPETPLQMATGASVLGAQGVYHQPYGIATITASDGTQVFKADPNNGARQVLDPKVAYIMEQIMSNDANRTRAFGANSALTLPGRRVGAKTGTAEQFSDGWTVGYTPSLASAFWFGNPDYSLMSYNWDGIYAAAPAWHEFMMNALNTLNAPPSEWFAEPAGLGHATVGGEPVWLLPGTNANQPMPALPSNVHTSSGPAPCPGGQNPNNGNNQNQNNPACQGKPTG